MNKKVKLVKSFSVRLSADSIRAIELSGESPTDWLRQAVRLRLESERSMESEAGGLEKRLDALQQSVLDIRKATANLQQTEDMNQAILAAQQKSLEDLQKAQTAFHRLLVKANEDFSEGISEQGKSLLLALKQQMEAFLKVQAESRQPIRTPPIPRNKL